MSSSLELQPETARLNWAFVLFLTTVHVLAAVALFFFSWSALVVTIFLHWLFGSIGICLGYHRLLSHRSFQVPQWLEYIIAVLGALAMQGGPIFWVAGHRLHHAHTEDEVKDPYSARRGFWWSHMLWLVYPHHQFFEAEEYARFAPDLVRHPFYRWLDRYFLLLQVPLALLLYGLGGWSWLLWGMFMRAVFLWHSTWLINSATHKWGYRRFETDDNSRNLWWAALLTYGEGWHNNHHAYPHVAKAGWYWWEVDPTWWVIRTLQGLGLASKVQLPPSTALSKLP
ncbi:fatty acid desaturase [Thermosynechococcus sp. GLH187]|uniref:acyl-CoA desaturase n=1 Tax=unclassified Thermosynechococcus TaxID=2622553 RepID=UPI001980484A|nr:MULTISPECIES: fatty acid desaturase [unclassified Thermosynechococcus]QSF48875.1 fatty acid desaturase [Thermosynechococcus sp. TA-1]WKT80874.1 fatty acid desaturase [Thermosynechococcus sp. PP45]WNC21929.1 fatty acid desaturase [Thermosynechococcus sp. PP22]WNC24485.1 fatty acid desaturase [Thermosynechococcus sp. PP551]WNC27063.1 fatty acid desaturase [Thermosynechococcus sp. PP555]